MKRLIGITGLARSGKDTAAEWLHNYHMMNRYAFAQPLKDMISAAFGHDIGYADGPAKEAEIPWLGKSPRQLLQLLGTEWGRELVHPELWVLLAEREWISCQQGLSKGLVISDVRFDNEAKWIRMQGGMIIKVIRPGIAGVNSHASEAGVSEGLVDYAVFNSSSLEALYDGIDWVMALSRGH